MTETAESVENRVLRSSAFFRGLSTTARQKLLASSQTQICPAGTRLFREGEPASAFFLVLDGWVKVTRRQSNGADTVIGVFSRGQTVADAIAIAGGVYPANAETVTRATIVRLDADAMRARVFAEPDLALAMIASSAQHLFLLMRQIEQLKARTSPRRVADFLTSLTEAAEGPATVALPFDKMLIAARLGMKPESLSRAFAQLRNLGVRVAGDHVRIDDVAALKIYAMDASKRQSHAAAPASGAA